MRSCLSNNLLRNPLAVPVFLVAVILAVYYPALLSGIHPIDDPGIIARYSSSHSLPSILLPGNSYYYRPVVELSYFLDNWLWGMEPGILHLENILLHCANTLLVYFLARRILVGHDNETQLIPLLAALLFALHPVNVEAVAWIAGRTDPLLALFVLSASFFWLRWLENPRWQDQVAALLMFGFALLTKETTLAFGVVAVMLAMTWPGAATNRQRQKAVVIMIAPGVLLTIFALLFRSGTSALSRFLAGSDLQVAQSTQEALIAFGFYFKKLIFPFPLNFAITAVHPMYGLLGVVLFPALWLVFRRYRRSGILLISAAILILPAIMVALIQISWTPIAERYLYLSSAFLALGMVGIGEALQRRYSVVLLPFFVLLLCGFSLGSYQRNLLWKDPLSFFQDAVAKSPEFGSVYHPLGSILMQMGEVDRAAEAFATADRLNQRVSMRYPIKSSIMGALIAKAKYLEARTYFFQLFKKKQDAPVDFLELLHQADSKRLASLGKKEKLLLAHDLLDTLGLLYVRNSDPFWLYRSGQISLVTGDNVGAEDYFRRAFSSAPVDAHYRTAAQKYLKKLERDE